MPADSTAGPAGAAQPEQNAEAKTTTEPKGEDRGSRIENSGEHPESRSSASDAIMDHLDIPDDVRRQLSTHKDEGGRRKPENASSDEASGEEKSPVGEHEEIRGEAEGEEEGEAAPEHDDDDDGATAPQLIKDLEPKLRKKLEKRFGRMTRKTARLEGELDAALQELEGFRSQTGAQAERAATAAPRSAGVLGQVQTEAELDEAVAYAKAVRKLAADNPDGIQTGEGENAKFHDAAELKQWKQNADEVLFDQEGRRRELREFKATRHTYDTAALTEFPELFDKTTKEFQSAVAIAGRYPWIREIPEANFALGVMVEGFKALEARRTAPGGRNGAQSTTSRTPDPELRTPRAIDERAFGPRVPNAPHAPNPPSREPAPSSQKELKRATQDLIADPDGGAAALAAVFAAREKAAD